MSQANNEWKKQAEGNCHNSLPHFIYAFIKKFNKQNIFQERTTEHNNSVSTLKNGTKYLNIVI